MTSNERTVTLTDGHTITIGGRVTMGDFRRWAKAEQSGDLETVYQHLAKVIIRWDYPGDPKAPESYDDLTFQEYRLINEAVAAWLRDEVAAKN